MADQAVSRGMPQIAPLAVSRGQRGPKRPAKKWPASPPSEQRLKMRCAAYLACPLDGRVVIRNRLKTYICQCVLKQKVSLIHVFP